MAGNIALVPFIPKHYSKNVKPSCTNQFDPTSSVRMQPDISHKWIHQIMAVFIVIKVWSGLTCEMKTFKKHPGNSNIHLSLGAGHYRIGYLKDPSVISFIRLRDTSSRRSIHAGSGSGNVIDITVIIWNIKLNFTCKCHPTYHTTDHLYSLGFPLTRFMFCNKS